MKTKVHIISNAPAFAMVKDGKTTTTKNCDLKVINPKIMDNQVHSFDAYLLCTGTEAPKR